MECLYSFVSKSTFEKYKRFHRARTKDGKMKRRILAAVVICIGFIAAALALLARNYVALAFVAVYWIVYFGLSRWIDNRRLKKDFRSAKGWEEDYTRYEFFDTYFVLSDDDGMLRLEYRELYGVLETKTDVILMTGAGSGLHLPREDMPEGLAEFLGGLGLKRL